MLTQILHMNLFYDWSMINDQLARNYIVIGWICEKMWFIKLPTENTFVAILDAFVKKCFCESSSFLQKCIRSYIGCICKKPPNVNGP